MVHDDRPASFAMQLFVSILYQNTTFLYFFAESQMVFYKKIRYRTCANAEKRLRKTMVCGILSYCDMHKSRKGGGYRCQKHLSM